MAACGAGCRIETPKPLSLRGWSSTTFYPAGSRHTSSPMGRQLTEASRIEGLTFCPRIAECTPLKIYSNHSRYSKPRLRMLRWMGQVAAFDAASTPAFVSMTLATTACAQANSTRSSTLSLGWSLANANAGRTHKIPLNDPTTINGYTLTPHAVDPRFPDDRWYHVHIESEFLVELLRTPKYHTWQGERWLFCCQRPMVFRGSLPADIFSANHDQLSSEMQAFLAAPNWKKTVGDGHGSHTYYVFTCAVCGILRYDDDCD